ncbi:DUF4129 domain-containing protein [Bacillus sp. FJAT-49732]|uniref:DUF4129 domain-containing protein n=1 Tax=Lederbergia citrisecunda TaxID=2833583 RepID=A0A942YKG9_9BACI|nr:DUF4129 domain-containing protein [Lederbergia citrisecunda]MBS4199249.1 DUF4129 domain-containing protein [Lederbergia citrisecunda]
MKNVNKAKDEIRDILNNKEYQVYANDSKSIFTIWWERAKEWIANQLEKLFPSLESASHAAAGPLLIAIIVIIVAMVFILAFLLVRRQVRQRKYKDHKPFQSLKEMEWTFQSHVEESERQESLGELTLATRHLFLSLLLYFHEKEWLIARIWKTNWEYYDELRKVNKEWAERFYNLALLFDEITYGDKTVNKDEYIQYKSQVMEWIDEDINDGQEAPKTNASTKK